MGNVTGFALKKAKRNALADAFTISFKYVVSFFSYKFILVFLGVSCDSCMKSNFRGRRFKCLVKSSEVQLMFFLISVFCSQICYDYDLCGVCHERQATGQNHTSDHAMQCILTRNDAGEKPISISRTVLKWKIVIDRIILWGRRYHTRKTSVICMSILPKDRL